MSYLLSAYGITVGVLLFYGISLARERARRPTATGNSSAG